MPSGRVLHRAALVLATLCFGLGFGLNFGKSNQAVYLLPSLQYLEPALWQRDFLANTHHYHPAYAALGVLALMLDGSGWLLALSNVLAACLGMWCVYRVLRARLEPAHATTAFLMLLALAATSSTGGPGGSYVFADIFQPSTLGSLGLLGACLAFVRGRWLAAGSCLALAGAFHLNYLLLGSCVFGAAWLATGKERFLVRGALLLGPALPVWIWFLPALLATSQPAEGISSAELRRIYQEVRAPHHYGVATFAPQLLSWLGFSALGIAALLPGAQRGHEDQRRLAVLLGAFAALILPVAVGALFSNTVAQLFAWRVAPHANLLAQAAVCGSVVHALARPAEATPSPPRSELALAALGAAALLVAAVFGAWPATAVLTLAFIALPWLARRAPIWATERRGWFPAAVGVVALAALAPGLVNLNRKSDLLAGRDRDLVALCGWLERTTPVDAVVLTPPDEDEVRFRCKRAVVVDWKATPILPAELHAWFQRIEDVTGRRPLRGGEDLQGYRELTAQRVTELRAKYRFDVVVVRADAPRALGSPDFSQGRFLAYRLQ